MALLKIGTYIFALAFVFNILQAAPVPVEPVTVPNYCMQSEHGLCAGPIASLNEVSCIMGYIQNYSKKTFSYLRRIQFFKKAIQEAKIDCSSSSDPSNCFASAMKPIAGSVYTSYCNSVAKYEIGEEFKCDQNYTDCMNICQPMPSYCSSNIGTVPSSMDQACATECSNNKCNIQYEASKSKCAYTSIGGSGYTVSQIVQMCGTNNLSEWEQYYSYPVCQVFRGCVGKAETERTSCENTTEFYECQKCKKNYYDNVSNESYWASICQQFKSTCKNKQSVEKQRCEDYRSSCISKRNYAENATDVSTKVDGCLHAEGYESPVYLSMNFLNSLSMMYEAISDMITFINKMAENVSWVTAVTQPIVTKEMVYFNQSGQKVNANVWGPGVLEFYNMKSLNSQSSSNSSIQNALNQMSAISAYYQGVVQACITTEQQKEEKFKLMFEIVSSLVVFIITMSSMGIMDSVAAGALGAIGLMGLGADGIFTTAFVVALQTGAVEALTKAANAIIADMDQVYNVEATVNSGI